MLEVARPRRRATTAGCPPCAASRFEVRAGEIVGLAGVDGNGQSELIEAITGLRTPTRGHDPRRRARTSPARRARRRSTPASATSPRTATGAASCSTSPSPRTSRCASTARPAIVALRPALAEAHDASARARCSRSTTSAAATPDTLAALAVGRQPAEGRDRARDRRATRRCSIAAQPTRGLDVGAIEFVHRRLVERARRGPRRPARLARARGDPLAGRPRAGDLRGRDRRPSCRPTSSEEELGVAMTGGGRARRRGVSAPDDEPLAPTPEAPGEGAPQTVAARLAGYLRGGGIITPLLTALLAFFVGGLVVARSPATTRSRPTRRSSTAPGLNWFFPWIAARRPHDRGAEPAADADPHDAADPHRPRGRLRVPLRPVQHRRPGPVPRRLVRRPSGSARRSTGMPRLLHIVLAMVAALRWRARCGRASRAAEGDARAPTR